MTLRTQRNRNPKNALNAALLFAEQIHRGQRRACGDPYLEHPLGVKRILDLCPISEDLLCAALLHDVLEHSNDRKKTAEELHEQFGDEVYFLVDAVTKDSGFQNKEDRDRYYQEKISNGAKRDFRVLFLKAADLLDNVKTLQYLAPAQQEAWMNELKTFYFKNFLENFFRIPPMYQDFFHFLSREIQKMIDDYEARYAGGK